MIHRSGLLLALLLVAAGGCAPGELPARDVAAPETFTLPLLDFAPPLAETGPYADATPDAGPTPDSAADATHDAGPIPDTTVDIAAAEDASPDLVPTPPVVTSSTRAFANIAGDRPTWEYGPSIVLENGTYYAFYCAPGAGGGWDSIRLTTSTDGLNWTASEVIFRAGGDYGLSSVCDPSVIKFHGVYLMYHTCINADSPPDGYGNNRICVAAADEITGPYHRYDQPIVQDMSCPSDKSKAYCVGQPSALVHDDRVYLYYTNRKPGVTEFVRLATSGNGVDFVDANGGAPVWGPNNVTVKRERSTGLFFLVQGEVNTDDLPWSVSADGINWLPYDPSRTIAQNSALPVDGTNHNPGLAGDVHGSFDGMTFLLYGSSYATGWGFWHLYHSDIIIDPVTNDCSQCVAMSCDLGCSKVLGESAWGHCAHPGTTPTNCCACAPAPIESDCSPCAPAGCVAACRGLGFSIGICAAPDIANATACCGCYP